MKQLSPHFTLDEMLRSDTAVRLGIDNTAVSMRVLTNLVHLAQTLERVRSTLCVPLRITSGYRCLALNRACKSSDTSAHIQGLAADFIAPDFGDSLKVARAIRDAGIPYDQLINEGGWVHLAVAQNDAGNRNQTMTAHFELGTPRYVVGLVKSINRVV
jgi:hypothetical protein